MNQNIVHVKFKIAIPKSKLLSNLSIKYPELDFKILSKLFLSEEKSLTLLQIIGSTTKQFILDFGNISSKINYQILFKSEDMALLSLESADPWILNAFIKSQLLLVYPLILKQGFAYIDAIDEHSKINNFLLELERKEIKYFIQSIGEFRNSILLTKRQKEILLKAYSRGYFEIPRKISLSKLAKELKISPSSLSETLRRITKKLSNFYLKSINIFIK
ncbi:MAG: helix-turn-helix domain-containing protein [Promethearchaeota archaeon]